VPGVHHRLRVAVPIVRPSYNGSRAARVDMVTTEKTVRLPTSRSNDVHSYCGYQSVLYHRLLAQGGAGLDDKLFIASWLWTLGLSVKATTGSSLARAS